MHNSSDKRFWMRVRFLAPLLFFLPFLLAVTADAGDSTILFSAHVCVRIARVYGMCYSCPLSLPCKTFCAVSCHRTRAYPALTCRPRTGVITCLFSGSDVFCEGHDMYRFCAPLEARLVEHNSSQADQANLSDSPLYSEDEISVGAETQQQEDTASGESDSDSVTVADNESESASLDNVIGDGADDKEASAGASVTAAVALAQPACLLRRGPSHDRLLALQELAAAQRMAETVVVAPPAVPVCSILRLRCVAAVGKSDTWEKAKNTRTALISPYDHDVVLH